MKPVTISSTDLARGAVDGLICIYKYTGETPLEALNRLRLKYPILKDVPLSYAGRLDPLAEGILLVLSGTFNSQRGEYLGYDKEYEVDVLCGVETDTGDTLGLIKHFDSFFPEDSQILNVCRNFVGEYTSEYPIYSSKTVEGKPLHAWANEGKISDIKIPTYTSQIYRIDFVESNTVSMTELVKNIEREHALITGEFRQAAVLGEWMKYSSEKAVKTFKIIVNASSGTYMRSLANDILKKLNSKGIALHIKRTKIGGFGVGDCLDL